MAQTQDYTAMMKDMMGAFPVDTKAFQDAFKSQTVLGEKVAAVALEAAEKSAEISNKWTKETIKNVSKAVKPQDDASAYAKAMTELLSANAEVASENLAAFAEIAKRVQADTVELLMAAGKEFQADASAAVKKATNDVASTAKKAAGAN